MNMTLFLLIFGVCAVLTPLLTEGVKKFLDGMNAKYATNVLVLITATIVSVLVMVFTYLTQEIPLTAINIFYIVFMVIGNWLGSMLGYDKVKQAIEQILSTKTTE